MAEKTLILGIENCLAKQVLMVNPVIILIPIDLINEVLPDIFEPVMRTDLLLVRILFSTQLNISG